MEFQYAETFLRYENPAHGLLNIINCRESDDYPSVTSEGSSTMEKRPLSESEDCPKFQVFPSTFSRPSPMLFSLQQKFEPSEISLSDKAKTNPRAPDTHRLHSQQNRSTKVVPKKVPPPTLPKPKFHPSFLTRQDINVNYVMTFPTSDQKF